MILVHSLVSATRLSQYYVISLKINLNTYKYLWHFVQKRKEIEEFILNLYEPFSTPVGNNANYAIFKELNEEGDGWK